MSRPFWTLPQFTPLDRYTTNRTFSLETAGGPTSGCGNSLSGSNFGYGTGKGPGTLTGCDLVSSHLTGKGGVWAPLSSSGFGNGAGYGAGYGSIRGKGTG